MSGQIHRQKKNKDFVTLDTHCLRNRSLKWDAKGLHSYLMQLPDEWKVNISDLEKRSETGRDGTRAAMVALIKAGYVYRERKQGEGGKFEGYDYHFFERPEHTVDWLTVNGKSVNGFAVNGKSATNKYYSPTDLNKNEEREAEREKLSPSPENSNFSLEAEKKEKGLQNGAALLPPFTPTGETIEPQPPKVVRLYEPEPPAELRRVNIPEAVEAMRNDQTALEGFVIGRKLPRERFAEYLTAFEVEQVGVKTQYKNERELRLHFLNWSGVHHQIAQKRKTQQNGKASSHITRAGSDLSVYEQNQIF